MNVYYHYTDTNAMEGIIKVGVWPHTDAFTSDEYFDASLAQQELGLKGSGRVEWVLKFADDNNFRRSCPERVPVWTASGEELQGGTQFANDNKPKPIAKRRIRERSWQSVT